MLLFVLMIYLCWVCVSYWFNVFVVVLMVLFGWWIYDVLLIYLLFMFVYGIMLGGWFGGVL